MADADPHLPRAAPIDAYGNGGFRFAGMSHRGSLLCLPDGIWAWPITRVADLTPALLAPVFAQAGKLDMVLIGGGKDPFLLPAALRQQFHDHRISVDAMTTAAAVRTWNILIGEGRRAGAGLIAVD